MSDLPEPVAWADDIAHVGRLGCVESAQWKKHLARGSLHDQSIAARLKHPLFTAEQMAAAVAQERERLIPDVDELAQHIRWLNGSNKRGAGSLAEELVEWLMRHATPTEPKSA